jgi:capsular polysaccharide biosynthesis protein
LASPQVAITTHGANNLLYQFLRKQVMVVAQPDFNHIQIKVITRNPFESVEIANAIAATYVRMRVEHLSRQYGEAAGKLVRVTRWASPPTHFIYPPAAVGWILIGVILLAGGRVYRLLKTWPLPGPRRGYNQG